MSSKIAASPAKKAAPGYVALVSGKISKYVMECSGLNSWRPAEKQKALLS